MNALPPHLKSPHLEGFAHGFFGRTGGVSAGQYASLNCGRGSRDNPAHVAKNRALVAAIAGGDDFTGVYQVHSAQVLTTTRQDPSPQGEADAIISTLPGQLIGVLTADCAPVLIADRQRRAVAAVHAGWRGAVKDILGHTVEALAQLGVQPKDCIAVAGPMIAAPSYEVGGDMKTAALATSHRAERYFASKRDGRYQFDLPGFVVSELTRLGFGTTHLVGVDTYTNHADWFSARAAGHQGQSDYGRNASVIAL
jgi:polyphenol oxidase